MYRRQDDWLCAKWSALTCGGWISTPKVLLSGLFPSARAGAHGTLEVDDPLFVVFDPPSPSAARHPVLRRPLLSAAHRGPLAPTRSGHVSAGAIHCGFAGAAVEPYQSGAVAETPGRA
jgi:hypothetical protein